MLMLNHYFVVDSQLKAEDNLQSLAIKQHDDKAENAKTKQREQAEYMFPIRVKMSRKDSVFRPRLKTVIDD